MSDAHHNRAEIMSGTLVKVKLRGGVYDAIYLYSQGNQFAYVHLVNASSNWPCCWPIPKSDVEWPK